MKVKLFGSSKKHRIVPDNAAEDSAVADATASAEAAAVAEDSAASEVVDSAAVEAVATEPAATVSVLKKVLTKKNILILSVNVFCLICFAVCLIISASLKDPFFAGRGAKAWAGQSGERFAQFSVMFPYTYRFGDEQIYNVRRTIDSSLLAASLEASESRTLYTDAWSAFGVVSISGDRGSAAATAIGVGGDFFLFHPFYLRSGSYISSSDVMRDRIVLDEELAWRLFGSVHLAGMKVVINGAPFVIAGVIARQTDTANVKAYEAFADGGGLFMSYEALNALLAGSYGDGGGAVINNYEIILPDPVSGFAKEIIEKAFTDDSLYIVDTTDRFSVTALYNVLRSFGQRSMLTDPIAFPYWENAARYAEDWLSLLLLISALSLVCPIVFTVIYLVMLVLFGVRKAKGAVHTAIKRHDDRAYEKYLRATTEADN